MGTTKSDCRTPPSPVWARLEQDRLVLQLQIQPGARRTQVVGLHGDRLKIALLAPPVDGQANAALVQFLGKQLGVGKNAVELLRGTLSREKTVAIRGDVASQATWLAQLRALAEQA